MPTVKGKSGVDRFFAEAPGRLTNVLRGAARAGANVVADEIKVRTPSEDVRDNVRIRTQKGDGQITVKIDVKPGWARSLGTWLEYGTSPHFITVKSDQRAGRGIGRINKQLKDTGDRSLVINGKLVGSSVYHKGSRAEPVFRPALDAKGREAIAQAQSYINSRVRGGKIADVDDPEGGDE